MAENLPLEVVRADADTKADVAATVEDSALQTLREKPVR